MAPKGNTKKNKNKNPKINMKNNYRDNTMKINMISIWKLGDSGCFLCLKKHVGRSLKQH